MHRARAGPGVSTHKSQAVRRQIYVVNYHGAMMATDCDRFGRLGVGIISSVLGLLAATEVAVPPERRSQPTTVPAKMSSLLACSVGL